MQIKTREALRTVKSLNRAESLAEKTKNGLSETKRQAEQAQGTNEESATDDAGSRLERGEATVARTAIASADRIGRWGIRETAKNIRRYKAHPRGKKVEADKRLSAPKGSKAVVKRSKTAGKTVKTAKNAAKTTAKGAKTAAKTLKSSIQAMIRFIKVAVKAIVAAVKAAIALIKEIVAAIVAGGWVAVVIILVIVILGGLIAAFCAFSSPDENAGEVYSLREMMQICENESRELEKQLIADTPHDAVEYIGAALPEREIALVYAAKLTVSDRTVQEISGDKETLFREVFFAMYQVQSSTYEREEIIKKKVVDEHGRIVEVEETVNLQILRIERKAMPIEEAVKHFSLDRWQREHLEVLLSGELDEY